MCAVLTHGCAAERRLGMSESQEIWGGKQGSPRAEAPALSLKAV